MSYASLPDGYNWQEKLADGHAGTLRTLKVMRWLVRKDFQRNDTRRTIQTICRAAQHQRPVEALFLFARDAIRYVSDSELALLLSQKFSISLQFDSSTLEVVMDFKRITEMQAGDCDDKIVWLATALMCCGFSVRFVVQSYGGGTWDHVYLEFWDWSTWGWISADPTADGHTGLIAPLGWRQPLPPQGREMTFEV